MVCFILMAFYLINVFKILFIVYSFWFVNVIHNSKKNIELLPVCIVLPIMKGFFSYENKVVFLSGFPLFFAHLHKRK